mgnify:FL=1
MFYAERTAIMMDEQFEKLKKAAPGYDIVPVVKEIFSDVRTPIAVMRALKQVSSCCFLLESAEQGENWGRYSFLGFDPTGALSCKDHLMTINDGGSCRRFHTDHPASEIRRILARNRSPRIEGLPYFTGGLVGYFAYEYAKYNEPRLDFRDCQESVFQDVDLMIFDKIIAFDHLRQKMILIVNIRTDHLEENYKQALEDLRGLARLAACGEECQIPGGELQGPFISEFSKEEYEEAVRRTQHYIHEGDIFQAVPSNCRKARFSGSLFNAYRVLRVTNPSPYMFYFSGRELEMTGASPETLVRLMAGKLETFPIAGTMSRGETGEEDRHLEEMLLHDDKELAEHNMLVDLGRNDVGKISSFGSVAVKNFHKIKKFSHVMHITSEVIGQIRPEYDAMDAVDAMLPAGTLSGAPKIRAMEILHELEKSPRGAYGGAVGYLDFSGNMDVCIGIRMAAASGGHVYVRSGGGVVADSVPSHEYEETVHKAQSMTEAIIKAQEAEGYDFTDR